MSFNPNPSTVTRTRVDTAEIDAGLRKYMLRVYNYMALGVAFTGAVSLFVASTPQILFAVAGTPLFWGVFLGILGLGWFAPRLMMSGSVMTAQVCFWVYAALWGIGIAPMLYFVGVQQGAPDDVARAFFIATATFAGLSLLGYTTKKNLSAFGTFFAMATIGLLIAVLVNAFFVQSWGFELVLSIGVVLVFSALTAYETQMIKNMYYESDGSDVATRKAIFGAFMLYGAFVTLFIWILNILSLLRGE
ncbi:MAG: Bax inhibitor-1/YccA family protein [Kiloniellales bacterium]|nr:Bax inhibitor-1/YccA family protein [Kiloniellales bacterium]